MLYMQNFDFMYCRDFLCYGRHIVKIWEREQQYYDVWKSQTKLHVSDWMVVYLGSELNTRAEDVGRVLMGGIKPPFILERGVHTASSPYMNKVRLTFFTSPNRWNVALILNSVVSDKNIKYFWWYQVIYEIVSQTIVAFETTL